MTKKLHILQIISNIVMTKPLSTIVRYMHNFIANFARILGICKEFAGNRVNNLGNVPRRGVVPKFSDLEVIALGITAEAFHIDSENYLFYRLHKECKDALPHLHQPSSVQCQAQAYILLDGGHPQRCCQTH